MFVVGAKCISGWISVLSFLRFFGVRAYKKFFLTHSAKFNDERYTKTL
jgi:hypothetical protein